ncbi:MAG: hypothetical protein JST96_11135 [Bacteroidetes bacterium]|nr:hypothetical protein [Bacteroidota bacterium]
MKKRILICAMLLVATISFSFAKTTDGINGKVTTSFKKDFANAHDTRWENGSEFIKATFSLNGETVNAYYTQDGDLMAVTRNILSDKLPITQLLNLKKNYAAYWISDLFEMYSNGETAYYLTIENADQKIVLKSDSSNGWSVYSKETKL